MILTDITLTKKGRCALFVDGEFLFSAHPDVFYGSGWQKGREVTVVSYGVIINEVLAALDGSVSAEIIKLNVLAPLDASAVVESVRKTGRLVVVEECFATGGMGQQICAALERAGVAVKELKLLSCGSDFVHQGSVAQLYHSLGMDAEGIRMCVNEVCHGESET